MYLPHLHQLSSRRAREVVVAAASCGRQSKLKECPGAASQGDTTWFDFQGLDSLSGTGRALFVHEASRAQPTIERQLLLSGTGILAVQYWVCIVSDSLAGSNRSSRAADRLLCRQGKESRVLNNE